MKVNTNTQSQKDNMTLTYSKRSRADRKAAQRIAEQELEEYRIKHPVLSGAVKIVDYVEPRWAYYPAQGARIYHELSD